MSKYTAQCLFYELDSLQQQLVDVNKKLKAERKRFYGDKKQGLPSLEGFRKEIGA